MAEDKKKTKPATVAPAEVAEKKDDGTPKWQDTILTKVKGIGKKANALKDKTGEQVVAEFMEVLKEEYVKYPKEKYAKRTELVYWKRAFSKFRNKHKKALRSNAISWLGKILGCTTAHDMMQKTIDKQLDLAKANLEKALKDGVIMYSEEKDEDTGEKKKRVPKTDDSGNYIARDARKTFKKKDAQGNPLKNRNYGKELKSSWSMSVYLICSPEDGTKPIRFGILNIGGNLAVPGKDQIKIPPTGANVQFMAIDKTEKPAEGEQAKQYALGSSSSTKFGKIVNKDILGKMENVTLAKLFHQDFMKDLARECDELEEFFEENGVNEDGTPNWNCVVLTRGDVVGIAAEKTQSGNKWITLERTTVEDSEDELATGFESEEGEEGDVPDSLTAWVPEELQKQIDFGEDSVLYVVGRPSKMQSLDDDKNPIKDDNDELVYEPVSMSAYGLWADPEFKEEVTKEDIEPNTGTVSEGEEASTEDEDEEEEEGEDKEEEKPEPKKSKPAPAKKEKPAAKKKKKDEEEEDDSEESGEEKEGEW